MAGDWHPIFNNLRDSPRVVRMARELKVKRTLIVGACSIWWAILDDHGSNGFVPGYGLDELDDEVQVNGFGAAMVAVGWIQVFDGGLFAPEWEKHNSHGAKVRLQERAKKKRQRLSRSCPEVVPESWGQNRDTIGTTAGPKLDTSGTTTTTTPTTNSTPPTPSRQGTASGGGGAGGESRDAGWEGRKAYWAKKPEWWPSKPWVSARGLDELADLTQAFSTDEVKAIMTDVRRQCAGLSNPAGYLVKAFRTAKAEKGGV